MDKEIRKVTFQMTNIAQDVDKTIKKADKVHEETTKTVNDTKAIIQKYGDDMEAIQK